MALYLEIIEGEEKGQRFRVHDGVQIGRTQGQIRLKDPKASGLHAQVEKDGKGQLILIDKESFNGLRINAQKVKRIALLPGVTFQIGKTFFKVISLFNEDSDLRKADENEENWREILIRAVEKIQIPHSITFQSVAAFPQPIELKFIEGIQTGETFILGYGPRRIGSASFDVELEDEATPDIAFEISPQEEQIIFKTLFPEQVLLNGFSVSEEILRPGDLISFGHSVVEVGFLK